MIDRDKKATLIRWYNNVADEENKVHCLMPLNDGLVFLKLVQHIGPFDDIVDQINPLRTVPEKRIEIVNKFLTDFYGTEHQRTDFSSLSNGDLETELGTILFALLAAGTQGVNREKFIRAAQALDEAAQLIVFGMLNPIVSNMSNNIVDMKYLLVKHQKIPESTSIPHTDIYSTPEMVASPFGRLSLGCSPKTPLGELIDSPQFIQKESTLKQLTCENLRDQKFPSCRKVGKIERSAGKSHRARLFESGNQKLPLVTLLRQKEEEIKKFKVKINSENHIRSELETTIQEHLEELQQKDSKIKNLEDDLIRNRKQYEEDLLISRTENDRQAQEIERLKTNLTNSMSDQKSMKKEINQIENRLSMSSIELHKQGLLEKGYNEYRTKNNKMQYQIDTLEEQVMKGEEKYSALQVENQRLVLNARDLNNFISTLKQQLAEERSYKEESFNTGENMGCILEKKIFDLEKDLEEAKAGAEELKTKLNELESSKNSEIDRVTSLLMDNEKKMCELDQNIQNLECRVAELSGKNNKLMDEVNEQKQAIECNTNERDNLQSEIDRATSVLTEKEKKQFELDQNIQCLENQLAELSGKNDELIGEVNIQKQLNESSLNERNTLQADRDRLASLLMDKEKKQCELDQNIHCLDNRVAELSEKNNELIDEVNEQKLAMECNSNERDNLQSEIARVTSILMEKEKKHCELDQNIQSLENQLSEMAGKNDELIGEVIEQKQVMESNLNERNNLQADKDRLASLLMDKEKRQCELDQNIQCLENQLVEQSRKNDELIGEVSEQKQMMESNLNERDNLQADKDRLAALLMDKEKRQCELEQNIQCLENQLAEQSRKNDELIGEVSEQKQMMESNLNERDNLQADKDRLAALLMDKEKMQCELDQNIQCLENQLAEQSRKNDELIGKVSEQKQIMESNLNERDNLQADKDRLASLLMDKEKRQCEVDQNIQSLENRVAELSGKNNEIIDEVNEQKLAMECNTNERDNLQSEIDRVTSVLMEKEKKQCELDQNIQCLENQLAELSGKNDELIGEVDEQKQVNESSLNERNTLQADRDRLASLLMDKEKKQCELDQNISNLEDKVTELLSKNNELKDEINEQKKVIESNLNERNKLQSENDSVKSLLMDKEAKQCELDQNIESLENRVLELSVKRDELVGELNTQKHVMETNMNEQNNLKIEVDRVTSLSMDKEKKQHELDQNIEILEMRVTELQAKNAELVGDLVKQKEVMESNLNKQIALQSEVERVTSLLMEKENQQSEQDQCIQNLEERVSLLLNEREKMIDEYGEQKQVAETKLKEQETIAEKLTTDLETSKHILEQLSFESQKSKEEYGKRLEQELIAHRQECDELRDRNITDIEETNNNISLLNLELKVLYDKVKCLEMQEDSYKSTVESLQRQNSDLKEELESKENLICSTKEEFENLLKTEKLINERVKMNLEQKSEMVISVNEEVALLSKSLETKEQSLFLLQQDLANIRGKQASILNEKTEMQAKCEKEEKLLQDFLKERDQQIKCLQEDLNRSATTCGNLSAEIVQLKELNNENCSLLKSDMENKESQIQQLNKELSELKSQSLITIKEMKILSNDLTEKDSKLKDFSEINSHLSSNNERLNSELESCQSQFKQYESQVESLKSGYSDLCLIVEEKNSQIKDSNDTHLKSKQDFEGRLNKKEIELENVQRENCKLHEMLESLSKDTEDKGQILHSKNSALQNKIDRLCDEVKCFQSEKEEYKNKMDDMKCDLQRLQNILECKEKEYNSERLNLEGKMKIEADKNKICFETNERELGKFRHLLVEKDKTCSQLQDSINNLKNQLTIITNERADLSSKLSEQKSANERLSDLSNKTSEELSHKDCIIQKLQSDSQLLKNEHNSKIKNEVDVKLKLESEVKAKDMHIKALVENISKLSDNLREASQKNSKLELRVQQMQQQVITMEKQVEETNEILMKTNFETDDKIKSYDSTLLETRAQIDERTKELFEMKQKLLSAQSANAETETALVERQEMQKECEQLKSLLEAESANCKNLQEKMKSSEELFEKRILEVENFWKERASTMISEFKQSELKTRLQKEVDRMKEKATKELSKFKAVNDKICQKNSLLEKQLEEMTAELEMWKIKYDELLKQSSTNQDHNVSKMDMSHVFDDSLDFDSVVKKRHHEDSFDKTSRTDFNSTFSSTESVRSIPRGTGNLFFCEDEPSVDMEWGRLSELQRRNTLCLPHMKSSYPVETQMVDGKGFNDDAFQKARLSDGNLLDLEHRAKKRKNDSLSDDDTLREANSTIKQQRLSSSHLKSVPQTPDKKCLRSIPEDVDSPKVKAKPVSERKRYLFRKTPKRQEIENRTPPSKKQPVSFSIGFTPKKGKNLTRQTAFIQKQPVRTEVRLPLKNKKNILQRLMP